MAEVAREVLLASVKSFLGSGDYPDLTITCGSDMYKVHKLIVCKRADFFARALKFGGQESQESKIDLPEDAPAIVELLAQYLYGGEYEPLLSDTKTQAPIAATPATPARSKAKNYGGSYTYAFPHTCSWTHEACHNGRLCPHHHCGNICDYQCIKFNCEICNPALPVLSLNETSEQLVLHAKMYEIADKYDVVGLKDLVIEKFNRSCQHFWDDPNFAAAAHHSFTTTPEHDKGLRNIVADTITTHSKQLVAKPEIKALLTEFNGLAYDLYKRKVEDDD